MYVILEKMNINALGFILPLHNFLNIFPLVTKVYSKINYESKSIYIHIFKNDLHYCYLFYRN